MKSVLGLVTMAAVLGGVAPPVGAQGHPTSAITLVIPLAPGDATDVVGRTMGDELAKLLKVPVVPVNRPGGGMTIGTDSVVKARKDGYTILLAPSSSMTAGRILSPETVTYDPLKDLTPLGMAARSPLVVVVRQEAPFKGFREMLEFSKKNPGKVHVGTAGAGTLGHFSIELINSLTGAGLTTVPFKGGGPGITALLGGHVEAGIYTVGALSSHLKSGAVRGVVISSRAPELPEVPTLSQLGYPQNFPGVWMAFYGPAGLPGEVSRTLASAVEKVAKDPAIGAKLAPLGIVQEWAPPDKVLTDIRDEYRTLQDVAKKAGLVK
jgi:tripartite-type tricarboxylate transporter receptor subunit TctC